MRSQEKLHPSEMLSLCHSCENVERGEYLGVVRWNVTIQTERGLTVSSCGL
jgi:hypothetical protein